MEYYLIPLITTICFAVAGLLLSDPFLDFWDDFALKYLGDLNSASLMLGLDRSYYVLALRIWGMALLVVFLVFGVHLGVWPIMLAMLYLIFVSPRLIMEYLVTRRKRLLRDQLVPALSVTVNSVKAGLSIEEAFREMTAATPAPLQREFKQIMRDHQFGRPFIAAINTVKEKLELPCFTMFATALTVCREQGGNLSDVLERLRKSLVESQRLERKLEAETASGNMVIFILSLVPFLFTLMMLAMHTKDTMFLFTQPPGHLPFGQCLFALVILLTYFGNRWGHHIMKIEF